MIRTPLLSRRQQFDVVSSTNDVVRGWLADGTPEVCLAVADEQSAGRGRDGRTWTAPAGHALLLSLGFRPAWLAPDRVWRLAAVTSMAMAEAGESVAGLPSGAIRLKWPNDLVIEDGAAVLKLAGVLGETDGLGSADPQAVIGIGINANWSRDEVPPALASTMTSLLIAGGRRMDVGELLEAFLAGLEPRIEALRAGAFDASAWSARQLTNDRRVRIVGHDDTTEVATAIGVDPDSGALVVRDGAGLGRRILTGEIQHLRLDGGV